MERLETSGGSIQRTPDVFGHTPLIVGEGNGVKYTFNFKIENLKVLEGNYEVLVSSKGISQFKNKDIDLEYYIALEPDSKYNI